MSGISSEIHRTSNDGYDPSKINLVQNPAEEDIVGTEHYVSPEMIESKQCSFSGDLWAFGVILYQFFSG